MSEEQKQGGRIRRTLALFEGSELRDLVLVFSAVVLMAVLEVAGVASIMPFLAVVSNPDIVQQQALLRWTWEAGGFTSEGRYLFALGLLVFGLIVLTNVTAIISQWLIVRFTYRQSHVLSHRLLQRYLGQPYAYVLTRNTAEMGTQMLSEVDAFVQAYLRPLMNLWAKGFTALAIVVLLLLVDPVLALAVTGIVGGAYGLIYGSIRGRLARDGQLRKRMNRARFKAANEALGGVKDLKVRGMEAAFARRFEVPSAAFARSRVFNGVMSVVPRNALEVVAFGAVMLILLYQLAVRGDVAQVIPVVGLYAFAGYRLMPKLQQVYHAVTQLRHNAYLLEVMERDLRRLAETMEPAAAAERPPFTASFGLREVVYGYDGVERPALDGITVEVPWRASVALVGSTGSGKTTCMDVMLGLLTPREGALVVDGVELDEGQRRAWRGSCGYVPQQIYLTDDTIRANIAFGVPPEQVDDAAVERAARIAQIHDFVTDSLPQGYGTVVGERGVRLSGGQRQRIGIARALYHDPEVLFLDEATSALDNVTERAIMEAMRELAGKKTLITIAHRLSTVRGCDTIHLLDRGRVVCSGTYDELLASSPAFRAMAEGEEQPGPTEQT